MESLEYLESQPALPAWSRRSRLPEASPSALPSWGATWRAKRKAGLLRHAQTLVGALPDLRSIATEMCALRGFDITLRGALPAGGTILAVDALDIDRALVLLSLFPKARVYNDAACRAQVAGALSMRGVGAFSRETLQSIVGDLAAERVVILRTEDARHIERRRLLISPQRDARVELMTSLADEGLRSEALVVLGDLA